MSGDEKGTPPEPDGQSDAIKEEPEAVPTDGTFFTRSSLYAAYLAESEEGLFATRDVHRTEKLNHSGKRVDLYCIRCRRETAFSPVRPGGSDTTVRVTRIGETSFFAKILRCTRCDLDCVFIYRFFGKNLSDADHSKIARVS